MPRPGPDARSHHGAVEEHLPSCGRFKKIVGSGGNRRKRRVAVVVQQDDAGQACGAGAVLCAAKHDKGVYRLHALT